MAAENMSNIARGYLKDQRRPRYLQPMTADGRYPWEAVSGTATTSSSSPMIDIHNTIDSSKGKAPRQSRKRTTSESDSPKIRTKNKAASKVATSSGSFKIDIHTTSTNDSSSSSSSSNRTAPRQDRKRSRSGSDQEELDEGAKNPELL